MNKPKKVMRKKWPFLSVRVHIYSKTILLIAGRDEVPWNTAIGIEVFTYFRGEKRTIENIGKLHQMSVFPAYVTVTSITKKGVVHMEVPKIKLSCDIYNAPVLYEYIRTHLRDELMGVGINLK